MKIGAIVHDFPSCASTNDLAKELAENGEAEGTAVICGRQTAGRGTKGRSWFSAPGLGLYASVILRPARPDLSLLPLLAGIAAAEAISRKLGFKPGLKWPNDLVWKGKKLGGILAEGRLTASRVNFVILGIGINFNHLAGDFPPEIRDSAISLRMISGRRSQVSPFLPHLWLSLGRWYGRFGRGDDSRIVETFARYSCLSRGANIVLMTAASEVRGTYAGLDVRGGLVLEVEGKPVSFYAAEVISIIPG